MHAMTMQSLVPQHPIRVFAMSSARFAQALARQSWSGGRKQEAAYLLGAAQHRGVCLLQLHAHILADELRYAGRHSVLARLDSMSPELTEAPVARFIDSHRKQTNSLHASARAHLSAGQRGDVLQVVLPVVTKPWRLHRRQLHACIKKVFVAPLTATPCCMPSCRTRKPREQMQNSM
jgi:hypothetical protein